MNSKGRPSNQIPQTCMHQQRPKKPETVKQYWSEHRITLLAYEAQYVYGKIPNQFHQSRKDQLEPKKKGSRKKVNIQYQSAFIMISPEQSQDIKVQELVKNYDGLNLLFNHLNDQNSLSVRQFIKILLELKHSAIVKQFCQIYNIIVKELHNVQFMQVEKQEPRFKLLQQIKEIILNYIEKNYQKFPYFISYLKADEKQTKKLLLVQSYCLLAEKFNFNINQFYSQAFSVSYDSSPSKKVKKG